MTQTQARDTAASEIEESGGSAGQMRARARVRIPARTSAAHRVWVCVCVPATERWGRGGWTGWCRDCDRDRVTSIGFARLWVWTAGRPGAVTATVSPVP